MWGTWIKIGKGIGNQREGGREGVRQIDREEERKNREIERDSYKMSEWDRKRRRERERERVIEEDALLSQHRKTQESTSQKIDESVGTNIRPWSSVQLSAKN